MTLAAEAWGWVASAFVLAAFLMRHMRSLRLTALASNLAFLVYAFELDLMPVLLLHGLLLPVNLWRLRESEPHAVASAWPPLRHRMSDGAWRRAGRVPIAVLTAALVASAVTLVLHDSRAGRPHACDATSAMLD